MRNRKRGSRRVVIQIFDCSSCGTNTLSISAISPRRSGSILTAGAICTCGRTTFTFDTVHQGCDWRITSSRPPAARSRHA